MYLSLPQVVMRSTLTSTSASPELPSSTGRGYCGVSHTDSVSRISNLVLHEMHECRWWIQTIDADDECKWQQQVADSAEYRSFSIKKISNWLTRTISYRSSFIHSGIRHSPVPSKSHPSHASRRLTSVDWAQSTLQSAAAHERWVSYSENSSLALGKPKF